ncbi:xylulokinase [Pullulanibacillus sp. KACC 23026]|uniref:xylulokinase n=1 Tax=Pullulanibacillus sp. KACC 23026 TaxID=3028315 RepID=UPI0023AFCE02|nr:xylulokinase [Pullulanibacillus sp. KACC 23026]WEG11306.1 xylulokinase [Pullulanibacillus sp. KACC 23026]
MRYVIGIDLGTSSVKALLVSQAGDVVDEASKSYPLNQPQSGYSEQNPEDWVTETLAAVSTLVKSSGVSPTDIEGISFSGQMHGLVLLDEAGAVIRPAILWNDTRTTEECRFIEQQLGDELIQITKNPALEGFTLPKILWVKKHEPENYEKATTFVLPKDYLRYRLTGALHMELSDAAGTLMLDVAAKNWSQTVLEKVGVSAKLCPPLIESHECVGTLLPEMAEQASLTPDTKVFGGGADNACGALGAGVLSEGKTMCSIGTSGVVLSYEATGTQDFNGKVHYFNHAAPGSFYAMGVTLSAGDSFSWFKNVFAKDEPFEKLVADAEQAGVGSGGLLFTPYLVGERTPHADADIRASFIGVDRSHSKKHFVRAVLEGITFSLKESVQIFRENGKDIPSLISIGGGAKSDFWLQLQADIFNATIYKLENEQGPGLGAAMLAAYGCGWYSDLETCSEAFTKIAGTYEPNPENAAAYEKLFAIYRSVYTATKDLNVRLKDFR